MELYLAEKIAENSYDEVEVREDYSGRGMYGETTAALTAESLSSIIVGMVRAAVELADSEDDASVEELVDFAEGMRTDNMGLGIVVY